VADYKLSVARSARKELQAMDRLVAMRIISRLESLAQDPRQTFHVGGMNSMRSRRSLKEVALDGESAVEDAENVDVT